VMLYIKPLKMWYMFDAKTNGHLQEFHDCVNVRAAFENLKEKGRNYYTLKITKDS